MSDYEFKRYNYNRTLDEIMPFLYGNLNDSDATIMAARKSFEFRSRYGCAMRALYERMVNDKQRIDRIKEQNEKEYIYEQR